MILAPIAECIFTLILLAICCQADQQDKSNDITTEARRNDEDDFRLQVKQKTRDFRWPNKQLNVLVDSKSLNQSEQQILQVVFDQIEHKTCLKVNKIPADRVNPFLLRTSDLPEYERNFIYVFKSQFGAYNRQPSIGLSSLGCVHQGRQSVVLTELAFKWPELVLRYHIMRSLGVDNIERPDGQVRKLLNMLPLSQKISSDEFQRRASGSEPIDPVPAYFAYATNGLSTESQPTIATVQYLSDEDVAKIKQLYECTELQNRLSVKPIAELSNITASGNVNSESKTPEGGFSLYSPPRDESSSATTLPTSTLGTQQKKLIEAEDSIKKIIDEVDKNGDRMVDEKLIDNAAKHIVDYLLSSDAANSYSLNPFEAPQPTTQPTSTSQSSTPSLSTPQDSGECSSLEGSCPSMDGQERSTISIVPQERPMLLKLDEFHAQDPQLQQANQMKLSQLTNDSLATYRLMNAPEWTQNQQQQMQQQQMQWQQQQQMQQQLQPQQSYGQQSVNPMKSEMLISFEQANNPKPGNPIAALASSQVLKLCSCTCQTMTPSGGPQTQPSPQPPMSTQDPHLPPTDDNNWTLEPSQPTSSQQLTPVTPEPTTITPTTIFEPPTTTSAPSTSEMPPPPPPPTTMTMTTTTEAPAPTTELPLPSSPPFSEPTQQTSEMPPPMSSTTQQPAQNGANYCELVEWVQPNKTVYASARIVWDVDRANQNYFLCNNMINGELVPGKTHGFSCKVSSEGKSYEMHSFNVLTKPENVNLAWVQRSSDSFGKTNFPVIGGFSKAQDPYVVSRCLVRDENNDVITLIGYVNSQGVGWFPFDDIQIECSQYDVLACVG